jgi:transcriptional regulator with XRE-family HTH domain
METVRFGRSLRALRRRRGWRQDDLALVARVSRPTISRIELGRADRLTIATVEAVANALGARVEVRLSWNGEALDRLLDAAHALLVEATISRLTGFGWDALPEITFNVGGERGSIDVLATHPSTGCLLVVEVKTVVPDLQAMLSTLDRKARLGRQIGAERGWRVQSVSRLLVIANDRTARRRVAAFEATIGRAFPVRGVDVDRWLRRPDPARPIAGQRFVTADRQAVARHRVARGRAGSCRPGA